jgi:N-acetylneuraminic acid mutarotase
LNRFSLRTVVPVVAAALASLIAASALAQTGTVADGFSEVTARPAAAHNYWTSGAPLPTAVTYQMTGVIEGKIYNVGGHSTKVVGDNQVYDPVANTWTTAASLPTPTLNAASAVVANILYIFGGSTSSGITNEVWAYNPKTNTWATKAAMPTARQGAVAVVENNLVYVIGGNTASTNRLSTVESYDPATNDWTTEAPLMVAKARPASGLLKTTIVAAGGLTNSAVTGDNEGYDATTNVWSSLTPDPTPRSHTCNGVLNTSLYSVGGAGGAAETAIALNEAFTLSKNKWITKASIPQAVAAPGSAVYKGLLYCFGGSWEISIPPGTVYNDVQIYHP